MRSSLRLPSGLLSSMSLRQFNLRCAEAHHSQTAAKPSPASRRRTDSENRSLQNLQELDFSVLFGLQHQFPDNGFPVYRKKTKNKQLLSGAAGCLLGAAGCLLGACFVLAGCCWVLAGCCWVRFWCLLGAAGCLLGACWVLAGCFFCACWVLLGACWVLLGACWVRFLVLAWC